MTPDHPEAAPLHRQVEYLQQALKQSALVGAALAAGRALCLPDWYLGAGAVAQTVWNLRHHFEPEYGINDVDLVYFDGADLSIDSEARTQDDVVRHLRNAFNLDVTVDVKNQARVHLWYADRFGRAIEAYRSTEEAIATWPTTASSVGVREDDEGLAVCAPFGLSDLLGMVVRPNKSIVTRAVYEKKTTRWTALWPQLRVIPW
jgi:hypothetical protein